MYRLLLLAAKWRCYFPLDVACDFSGCGPTGYTAVGSATVAGGFDCLVPSPLMYATREMSSSSLICPWKFGTMFLNVRLAQPVNVARRCPRESALHTVIPMPLPTCEWQSEQ
jgi:hypothetical protein